MRGSIGILSKIQSQESIAVDCHVTRSDQATVVKPIYSFSVTTWPWSSKPLVQLFPARCPTSSTFFFSMAYNEYSAVAMGSAFLEYCQFDLWPNAVAVWHRLDVPSWDIYHPVLQECVSDIWKAGQSTAHLSYLTLRPLAILFMMLMEGLWEIAKVLFSVLLSQGWVHIKKGMVQLKAAAIWFYHFQMSLSRMELLGEVVLIGTMVGLYYAYKWLRRQTYWQRFMQWYSEKKQRAIEVSICLPYFPAVCHFFLAAISVLVGHIVSGTCTWRNRDMIAVLFRRALLSLACAPLGD